jgi:Zn-dependent membrane protease YugP
LEQFLYLFEFYGYYFVLIAAVFSMIAGARVNSTFKKFSRQFSSAGITGEQAAKKVLENNGVFDVKVERTSGNLTDHYHPTKKTIFLSESVYSSTSTAAIGVAAHEAGHAVQHAKNYLPSKVRTMIVPVTNFGSRLGLPLVIIGLLITAFADASFGYFLSMGGLVFFSFSVIFQIVTLPTEFDASRRAMEAIRGGNILNEDEMKGARKTLTAAAMTYVAALAVSLLQFLRLLAIVMNGRRRR